MEEHVAVRTKACRWIYIDPTTWPVDDLAGILPVDGYVKKGKGKQRKDARYPARQGRCVCLPVSKPLEMKGTTETGTETRRRASHITFQDRYCPLGKIQWEPTLSLHHAVPPAQGWTRPELTEPGQVTLKVPRQTEPETTGLNAVMTLLFAVAAHPRLSSHRIACYLFPLFTPSLFPVFLSPAEDVR